MSGATMAISGCAPIGTAVASLFLLAAALLGAMLTFFVPVTIVYIAHALSSSFSRRK